MPTGRATSYGTHAQKWSFIAAVMEEWKSVLIQYVHLSSSYLGQIVINVCELCGMPLSAQHLTME